MSPSNLLADVSPENPNSFLDVVWNFASSFEFKPEFTAGNVIQALAALIATGILASFLQRRNLNNRKEKDILIEDSQSAVKIVEKLIDLGDTAAIVEIASLLKQFQVSVRHLRSNLDSLKYPQKIIKMLPSDEDIKTIRTLATDTPIGEIENHAKSKRCSAVVRQGIITLTQERRATLYDALQTARAKLQSFRLEVNRR